METESYGTLDKQASISNDSDSKEIDTKEILEELYHGWLGEKIINGVWVRDPTLKRMMNESGASFLISEIKSRFIVDHAEFINTIKRCVTLPRYQIRSNSKSINFGRIF